MKKKSIAQEMAEEGLFLTGSSAAMGAMPSNEISPYFSQGLANYSKFYPARFSMAGIGLTMEGMGKVKKAMKKLK